MSERRSNNLRLMGVVGAMASLIQPPPIAAMYPARSSRGIKPEQGPAYRAIMANSSRGILNDISVKVQPNRPPGSHKKRRRQIANRKDGC